MDLMRRKGVDEAWNALEEMQRQKTTTDKYTVSRMLMKTVGDGRGRLNPSRVYRGIALVEKFIDLQPKDVDEVLFNALLDTCCRLKDLSRLESIVNRMRELNVQPSPVTLGILVKTYGQAGDMQKVLQVWGDMEKQRGQANAVTYGCMIDACVKCNNLAKAVEIFKGMRAEGKHKNTILYTTLIKGYGLEKDLTRAMELFREMPKEGVPYNTITYNSILDACVKCSDLAGAEGLLREMLDTENSHEPDLITFSTLLKGYCHVGDLDKALQTAETIKARGLRCDELVYNTLMDGCVKANDITAGVGLFEDRDDPQRHAPLGHHPQHPGEALPARGLRRRPRRGGAALPAPRHREALRRRPQGLASSQPEGRPARGRRPQQPAVAVRLATVLRLGGLEPGPRQRQRGGLRVLGHAAGDAFVLRVPVRGALRALHAVRQPAAQPDAAVRGAAAAAARRGAPGQHGAAAPGIGRPRAVAGGAPLRRLRGPGRHGAAAGPRVALLPRQRAGDPSGRRGRSATGARHVLDARHAGPGGRLARARHARGLRRDGRGMRPWRRRVRHAVHEPGRGAHAAAAGALLHADARPAARSGAGLGGASAAADAHAADGADARELPASHAGHAAVLEKSP
ncbi:unnamed protein product [Prorocentrum cordatum]|uniref:PROP1-like PPR domain-containing protein n=1 Tax=Prorocentrum cordatum TaxID=2364126 RepID=A0ABN9W374_9DINO|nr:unnamed protein product [Polarella glacialis]